jgi:hypothetical protein
MNIAIVAIANAPLACRNVIAIDCGTGLVELHHGRIPRRGVEEAGPSSIFRQRY